MKIFKLIAALLTSLLLHASAHAGDYFDSDRRIGCGTITYVGVVDQDPIESNDLNVFRLESEESSLGGVVDLNQFLSNVAEVADAKLQT